MPLEICLSSVAQATPSARVSVEGSGVFLDQAFPPGGALTQHVFQTPAGFVGNLTIYFNIASDQLRIDINNKSYDSVVSLLALQNRAFLGGVYHAAGAQQDCVVICASGQKGTNCVVCTDDGITARVCC